MKNVSQEKKGATATLNSLTAPTPSKIEKPKKNLEVACN